MILIRNRERGREGGREGVPGVSGIKQHALAICFKIWEAMVIKFT
jgi:hypothetical protein